MNSRQLQQSQVEELAETFSLLSDPTRLAIVLACMEDEQPAGGISSQLGISPSLTSHHLRLLRSAKLMKSQRRGKQVFYSIADDCVRRVLEIMITHVFIHEHDQLETA